jgi:hypothetical protein
VEVKMVEKLLGIVPLVRKPKSFGRSDTYTLILTESRMVFALLTSDMIKKAADEAQRKGKEDGKGFLARWADQLKACSAVADRYWEMSPDAALSETKGNFALPNSSVRKVKVSTKGGSDDDESYTELKIEAAPGKLEYRVDGDARSVRDVLSGVFGDLVK